MKIRHPRQSKRLGPATGLLLLASTSAAAVAGLTGAERDGYLLWLHSLETTLAAREAALPAPPAPLFPVGWVDPAVQAGPAQEAPAVAAAGDPDASLVQVAAAIQEIESRPRLLQEPPSHSALHAVNRARNYLRIAQFDSALVWYATAARRDAGGDFTVPVGLETMVAAVAGGDSLAVLEQLLSTLGGRELAGRRQEIELAYRYFVARDDSTNLELLVHEAAAHPELVQGELAYWNAFALAQLGRWEDSLARLRALITAGGLSQGLDEQQRAWVLVALPDLLLLCGQQDEAGAMYRSLAASTVPRAATWAACQAAALDLLAGRFLEAGTAFERVCEASGPDTWRNYACSMAELADELERLRQEGEPHGVAFTDHR
jgi:hypothetical protein